MSDATPATPVAEEGHDGWGSRKLWFALGLVATATALLIFGKLDSDAWVSMSEWTYIAYTSGNVLGDWGMLAKLRGKA